MSNHQPTFGLSPDMPVARLGLLLALLVAGPFTAEARGQDAPSSQPAPRAPNSTSDTNRLNGTPDGISGKVLRYAAKLVAKHDADLDGRLQEPEWRRMSGTPRLADLDGNGILTVEELAQRVASYSRQRTLRLMPARRSSDQAPLASESEPNSGEENSPTDTPTVDQVAVEPPSEVAPALGPPASGERNERRRDRKPKPFYVEPSRMPKGIASWFRERDANGDGQVSMVEFSSKWSQAEALEFARYDKNGDGIITPDEAVTSGVKRNSEPPPAASADAGLPAPPAR